MFENAGKSIKNVVKIVTGVQIVLFSLIGLLMFIIFSNNGSAGLGLLVAAIVIGVGCFSAWLSGLVLYAFGEIADRVVCIDEKLSGGTQPENVQIVTGNQTTNIDWDKEPQWKCYNCGTSNPMKRGYCIKCNTSREWSLKKQELMK